ncbi:MAG: beta-lactamase family protein [Proteobacteria bacterium]|nr:beta-lactamase family protein [Pseudomonadota bacterium]
MSLAASALGALLMIPAGAADFPAGDPAAEGVDPARLEELLRRADEEHSDAVLVLRRGKLLASRGTIDRKIMAMSATKSIVSLAVGALVDDGRIKSLDQPVSDFFPEWRAGEKAAVTLLMLLNHTSGLDPARGFDDPEGVVAHALKSPLVSKPGETFVYNNNAADLLAGVIEKASGERADKYMARRLFAPLGITDWDWGYDAVGTPKTAGELMLRPVDLAKLGQLVLQGGRWEGKQIVSADWIARSSRRSQTFTPLCGLLWWLAPEKGQVRAAGWLGQYLVIEPARGLVAVRMRRARRSDYDSPSETDGFPDFAERVHRLLAAP